MNKQNTLMTLSEACDYLKIKKSRIRTAIFRREIPFIKIGRLIRFDQTDLQKWIENLKTNNEVYQR